MYREVLDVDDCDPGSNRERPITILSDDESDMNTPVTPLSRRKDFTKLIPQKRPLTGRSPDDARTKKRQTPQNSGISKSSPVPVHSITTSHRTPKRKRENPTNIRDGSSDEVQREHISQRTKMISASDSDENYLNSIASLDDAVENWKPFKEKAFNNPVILPAQYLSRSIGSGLSYENMNTRRQLASHRLESHDHSNLSEGPYIWTLLRNSRVRPKDNRNQSTSTFLGQMRSTRQTFREYLQPRTLELCSSFRQAPGAVNKITQTSGSIAICTAALGGHPDNDDEPEEPNAYNNAGSLMVWQNGKVQILHGHDNERPLDDGGSFRKFYTVNDIVVDPTCPTRMVSSGNDKTVRIWSYSSDHSSVNLAYIMPYKHVPQDLSFRPGESTLAIACKDGNISIVPRLDPLGMGARTSLRVAPRNWAHATGAISWGRNATSCYLFASSEPSSENDSRGSHCAFDLEKIKFAYKFDANEAGDDMALDGYGECLVLFTRGASGSHIMRKYDIRRKDGCAIRMNELEPFSSSTGEVNRAKFSPDMIYLAVARNDNVTHVYDSRMIERGVLHVFEHTGAARNIPGSDPYGIMELYWVDSPSRRLGLVTGGTDGSIRIWDVRLASDDPLNGTVIAETDFDIGHFSLGDPRKGEKSLVVGDTGGGVSIFDQRSSSLWTDIHD